MTEYVKTVTGRRYPFIGSGAAIQVSIDDGGGRYLRHLAETFPAEFARSIKSAGYNLRKDLQTDIYRGGPSEARWNPLSSIQAKGVLDDAKGRKFSPRTHPMGDLVRAIGYRYDEDTQSVRVGWLSHSAAKRGAELQTGFKTRVTKKMRRFFWGVGIPVKKGQTMFSTPARDLFDTVLRSRERHIQAYIENKVHEHVQKSGRFSWVA